MKKIALIFFLFSYKMLYAQMPFELHAKVPASLNNQKIYLRIYDYYSQKKFAKIDSVLISNGEFSFHGKIDRASEFASIYILKQNKTIGGYNFILDAHKMQMIVNQPPVSPKYAVSLLENTTILNSASNTVRLKLDSVSLLYRDKYSIPFNQSAPYPRYLPPEKERELATIQFEFLKNYPNEYFSLMEVCAISNMSTMMTEFEGSLNAFRSLSADLRSTPLGKEFLKMETSKMNAYNAAKAGVIVPNFSVKTDKGVLFSNSALKGKPYIIAFSATWCAPCQAYQNTLLDLYHKYKKDNLNVVYFNLDDKVDIWKKHITEKKLDWINVSECTKFADSKIARQFFASAIPLYIIVNSEGRIIYNGTEERDYNHDQLEKFIQKAIAN